MPLAVYERGRYDNIEMYSKSFSSTLAPLGNGTHGTLTLKACTISSGVFPARRSQRQGGANGKEEPTSGLAPWHQELPARRSQQVPKKTSNLQLHSEGTSLASVAEAVPAEPTAPAAALLGHVASAPTAAFSGPVASRPTAAFQGCRFSANGCFVASLLYSI